MKKTYRNKVTGVELIVPCALKGPDWEEVTEAKAEPEKAEKAPAKAAPKKKTVKKG